MVENIIECDCRVKSYNRFCLPWRVANTDVHSWTIPLRHCVLKVKNYY